LALLTKGLEFLEPLQKKQYRLRLSVGFPLVSGVETLLVLRESEKILDPMRLLKITRGKVYKFFAFTVIDDVQSLVAFSVLSSKRKCSIFDDVGLTELVLNAKPARGQ